MSLIQCQNISTPFGHKNISLSVSPGEAFALIGENGTGKTSLLRLLMGEISPDSGRIIRSSVLTIGYLPQHVVFSRGSVRSYLEEGPLRQLEAAMALALEAGHLEQWGALHEEYERLGGYSPIPLEKVLQGLKIEPSMLDVDCSALSGGAAVRIALAKAILSNPDLLLLDEPTNHLDCEMVDWLSCYIAQRKGASIIVSHDRKFLNASCNRLLDLRRGEIIRYGGNYDDYLCEKERARVRAKKAYEEQGKRCRALQQEIKALSFSRKKVEPPKDRNLMAYDRRGEKHQRSVQRKLDLLKAELADIEAHLLEDPTPPSITGLYFSGPPLDTPTALDLSALSKSYGDVEVLPPFSERVERGDRILLTGPNGSGKTTLLRCIAGELPLDGGACYRSPSVHFALLPQEPPILPGSALDYFTERYALSTEQLLSEVHKAGLADKELIFRPFSALSVGQRKRLMLLRLVLEKPNVLLLDEPTNHLDLATIEALERALLAFEGALIAISHDETFIEKIATKRWELPRKSYH